MGFLNKAFRKGMKKQVAQMPRRGGGFGNLGEAIRRWANEQRGGDMGMPRMPRIDDGRMRAMPIGPGARLQMPNFGEQMPTLQESRQALARKNPIARRDPSALERLPMGNMPDFSQIDMSQLDLSGIPQSISQMNLPQMPEGLPSMEEIQGNRRMPQMGMGEMQPRMMMAEGDEVFMPSNPNQIAFSIETEIKNLMNEYEMAANNGEIERAQMVAEQINELEARRIQAMNEAKAMESGRTISDMDRQMGFKAAGSIGSDDQGNPVFPEYSGGGYVNGYAEGDEVMMALNGGDIESMLSGMDSGEQEAMGELEQMAPEMEMIDQLVNMVVQMIQQGAGEEQVISFLREQGLDDEDIGTVLQLVAEMAETEEVAAQNEIGADLEQLG
jgi:hypothetical protein